MKTQSKSNRLLRLKILWMVCLSVFLMTEVRAALIVHNISTSDLIIPGNSTNDYVITGSTTTYKVEVGSGYKGDITLRNLTIHSLAPTTQTNTYPPFRVYGLNNCSNYSPVTVVNIILEGVNDLSSVKK